MRKNKLIRRFSFFILIVIIFLNIVAYLHAYKFTHFSQNQTTRTPHPNELSFFKKLKIAATGVNNPRPQNDKIPARTFETVQLQSNKKIEGWLINSKETLGTIVIAHGYAGQKATMLDKADVFLSLGYDVLLLDFMGSGGSEGNQTTIGYHEAEQIKTSFDFLKQKGENNIILFGTSMGAVAIMKAISDFKIQPSALILECPFGTMYETVCARFRSMKIPQFPMAALLVFWGGIQNGFWAFNHNPRDYASSIFCPTLLMYGEEDERVTRKEIDEIFNNLQGQKKLSLYPLAGHENYLIKYHKKWTQDVRQFLIPQ